MNASTPPLGDDELSALLDHEADSDVETRAEGDEAAQARLAELRRARDAVRDAAVDPPPADVIDRLKVFTFLSRVEIEQFAELVRDEPFRRAAQKRLALEVTGLVHGGPAVDAAIAASAALFGQGDLRALDAQTLSAVIAELPTAEVGEGDTIVHALVATGLCSSASDARRAISQGGVALNNVVVTSDDTTLTGAALAGRTAVLRRGKKTIAGLLLR